MIKLLFLLFAPAAALTGYSFGYVLRHPTASDRLDAAIMSVVCSALWALSVFGGLRWRCRVDPAMRLVITISMVGAGALGPIVFAMVVSGLLG
jgi:hypothetical protein